MVRFIQRSYEEVAGGSDVSAQASHGGTQQRETNCGNYKDLRNFTGGIFSASRYLATVRRATTMPCSASISAILLSEIGLFGSSAPINCLIKARIAVEDASPPASVATWLPKKYFNSNTPCGVSIYFCVVTREIVLSCNPSVSAISRKTRGRIATAPCEKKLRWRSTIACATRRMVSKRWRMFLISHLASCSWEVSEPSPLLCFR